VPEGVARSAKSVGLSTNRLGMGGFCSISRGYFRVDPEGGLGLGRGREPRECSFFGLLKSLYTPRFTCEADRTSSRAYTSSKGGVPAHASLRSACLFHTVTHPLFFLLAYGLDALPTDALPTDALRRGSQRPQYTEVPSKEAMPGGIRNGMKALVLGTHERPGRSDALSVRRPDHPWADAPERNKQFVPRPIPFPALRQFPGTVYRHSDGAA